MRNDSIDFCSRPAPLPSYYAVARESQRRMRDTKFDADVKNSNSESNNYAVVCVATACDHEVILINR